MTYLYYYFYTLVFLLLFIYKWITSQNCYFYFHKLPMRQGIESQIIDWKTRFCIAVINQWLNYMTNRIFWNDFLNFPITKIYLLLLFLNFIFLQSIHEIFLLDIITNPSVNICINYFRKISRNMVNMCLLILFILN